jgi:hypothetical protein
VSFQRSGRRTARPSTEPPTEAVVAPNPRIEVKKTLHNPHPLIAHLAQKNPAKSIDEHGVFYLRRPETGFSFPVSPSLFHRALRIADALFRAFDERKWNVRPSARRHRPAEIDVMIGGQEIPVRLRERLREVPNNGGEWRPRYEPSGILELTIESWFYHGRKRFIDGKKRGTIENHLAEFVDALEKTAETERIADLERKEENRRWEEARRRWEEEQARRKREAEKGRRLEEQAVQWSKARVVSDYLAGLTSVLRARAEPPAPEIEEWLRWNENYVRRLCPISSDSYGPTARTASSS